MYNTGTCRGGGGGGGGGGGEKSTFCTLVIMMTNIWRPLRKITLINNTVILSQAGQRRKVQPIRSQVALA